MSTVVNKGVGKEMHNFEMVAVITGTSEAEIIQIGDPKDKIDFSTVT